MDIEEEIKRTKDFTGHFTDSATRITSMFCSWAGINDDPTFFDTENVQYRLLRNLVYARHGYIFRSEDLRAVFSRFTWYEPNPDFSESMLSGPKKNTTRKS